MNRRRAYIVFHFYKGQPVGVGAEVAFSHYEDALAYIKKDPMIGTEKEFTHWDHYAICVVDYRERETA